MSYDLAVYGTPIVLLIVGVVVLYVAVRVVVEEIAAVVLRREQERDLVARGIWTGGRRARRHGR
jgi:protein-S-isoprenylcysteine O-methyltransferase Ste14